MKKQKTEQAAGLIGLGVLLFVILLCCGVSWSSSSSPPSSLSSPSASSSPAPKPAVKSDYATDQARLLDICGDISEGRSLNYREALILAARQQVRTGAMSKSAYEEWTKEKFPND